MIILWVFITLISILTIVLIIIGCLKDEFSSFKLSTTNNPYSYLEFDGKNTILHSSTGIHKRSDQLWAEYLKINGPIVKYLTEKKIPFEILGRDIDYPEFELDKDKTRLVSARTPKSGEYTFPIPQHDKYFEELTAYRNKPNVPYNSKLHLVIWRGKGSMVRDNLIKDIPQDFKHNIKIIKENNDHVPRNEQLKYLYILAIDGHGWPGSINWTLESGSVPLLHSTNHVWYYPLLRPWEDYVPVENGGELPGIIQILEENQELAQNITKESQKTIRKIHNLQKEYIDHIFSGKSYNGIMKILQGYLHPPLEFVHIPKTAGTAIEHSGKKGNILWGSQKKKDLENYVKFKEEQPLQSWFHNTTQVFPVKTFTIVRNPYDRMVSEFNYRPHVCEQGNPEILNSFLQEHIQLSLGEQPHIWDNHFRPMSEYVFDSNGIEKVDHILYYEDLENQFHNLMDLYGLNVRLLPKKINPKTCNMKVSDLSESTKRLIRKVYEKDFTNFGYYD